MKPGRIFISLFVLLGLLAGIPAPGVHAAPTITFSEYGTPYNMVVPDDSEDTIEIMGGFTTSQSGYGAFMLENLCEGEGCKVQDIYYKVELSISWFSNYGEAHPTWDVAPRAHVIMGSPGTGMLDMVSEACGGPYGNNGSCNLTWEGKIDAADINLTPGQAQETFLLAWNAYYGGLTITNTHKITFSTSPILNDETNCSGQYALGPLLGVLTIYSNQSTGTNMKVVLGQKYPAPGSWYVVRINEGHWHNNGTAPELTDIGIKVGSGGTWFPIGTNPALGCSDPDNDTYYLQMIATDQATYLGVYDTDDDYLSNIGTLQVYIYGVAAYNRFLDGCELRYDTGEFIEQKQVDASWSNGWPLQRPWYLPWNVNASGGSEALQKRYYMLETFGGPANIGGAYTFRGDLGLRAGEADFIPDNWYETITAPFVECVILTDLVGHVKVYFALDEQIDPTTFIKYFYAFRVHDTGAYLGNSGNLSYKLYATSNMQVTDPGDPPEVDGCAKYSHGATPTQEIVIQGSDSSGENITGLTSGTIYGFVSVDGPWKDDGFNRYSLEISDDNGNTWIDLEDYPNLLCASSPDGNLVTIYVYATYGKVWAVRANDADSNFLNNTQSMGMEIYVASTGIDDFSDCEDAYFLNMVNLTMEARTIPGESAAGKTLMNITSGQKYAIEITDKNKWYEAGAGTGSYLVDISDDGGTTWEALEDYGTLCNLRIGDGDRIKTIFTATSNNYKLRVRDGDDNFLSNTGKIIFTLYSAQPASIIPGGPGDTGAPPAEWIIACNEAFSRPDGFISWSSLSFTAGTLGSIGISLPIPRVGEWLEYIRNSIMYYFAWCPEHTDALKSMGDVYMDKEPMATIQAVVDFVKSIRTVIAGYQATGGEAEAAGAVSQEPDLFSDIAYIGQASGGDHYKGSTGAGPWDIFTVGNVDPETSVWFGGELDLAAGLGSTDLSSMDGYQVLCTDRFYPLFGIGADPYCSLMALMRYSSIATWMLLGIDLLLVIWWFFKYMPGYLKRLWNVITGNKSTIKRIIG